MLIFKKNLIIVFSMLFILTTIPFNFFYNYLKVKGVLPSIPEVGYPIFTHFFSLIILAFFVFNFNFFKKFRTTFYFFMFFCLYVFIFSLLNLMYFNYAGDFSAFSESFFFLMYYISFVVVFCLYYNINPHIFKVCFLVMFFVALFEMDFSKIIPFSFDNIAGTDEGHINYQLVSFFMLATWFMFFFKENNLIFKIFFMMSMAFLLLFSGGRSELFGFFASGIATLLAYIIFSDGNRYKKYGLIFFGGSSLFYLIVSMISKYSILFESSRHSQILDIKSSSSWQEREYLYEINVQKIIDSPILGNYGSHKELGEGTYIHNALSAWQQFGLVGFLLYIILILTPVLFSIYYIFKDKDKYNIYPLFFISFYVMILCLATKPIFWPYAGISLGLLFSYMKNREYL